MMDKTRGVKYNQYNWNWRHIVVHVGGLGWLFGLIVQILWNALGSMASLDIELRDDTVPLLIPNSIQQNLRLRWSVTEYTHLVEPLLTVSLVLGFLCIWWNPRLSSKMSGKVGRLVGLSEFYKLQGILNLTRLLAWYSICKDRGFHLDSSNTRAVHALMLVFNLVVSLISYRTVHIDSTPKVIFHDSPQPRRSQQHTVMQAPLVTHSSTPSTLTSASFKHNATSVTGQFPIDRLASPSSRTYTSSYQPPTPPPEDDADKMDWTPAKDTFNPSNPVRLPHSSPLTVEPSPFHGRLPLPPMSKARYLRNPPKKATFRKTPAAQQQRFFGDIMSSVSATSYDRDEAENESQDDLDVKRPTPVGNRLNMDRPEFFAQTDLEADTGLESLIKGVFSLADDPPEIRAERERQIHEQRIFQEDQNLRVSITGRIRAPWERIVSITLLSLACLSWSYSRSGNYGAQFLRFFALGTSTVIIGRALFDAISTSRALLRASDILVLGVELGITIFLGRVVKISGASNETTDYEYGSGSLLFFGALWFQEFISFVREFRASVSNAATSTLEPPSDPTNKNELAVTLPPAQDQNLALIRQDESPTASQSKINTKAAPIEIRPRRTKVKRVEPSENLPGLSIGSKKAMGNSQLDSRSSGWSSNQSFVSRNTRSSNGIPVWGRGNL